MLRRDLLTVLPATLLLGSAASAHAKPDKPALSLSIAVGKRFGTKRSIEYRDAHSHFTVVLRNESDQPQRVWREWCSWGFFNLSFTAITTGDGKQHKVVKDNRGWDKNYPDFEEFLPGETIVRDVYFGADEWKGFPRGASDTGNAIKLQAFYKIGEDEDTTKHGVWSGSLESPALDVIVYGLG